MPSKSKKQEKLMRAAAHDPAFAKKAGVPQDVAQEFNKADEMQRRGNALLYVKKPAKAGRK